MANSRSASVLTDQFGSLYGVGAVGSRPDDHLVERFLNRNDPHASDAAFRALVDDRGRPRAGVEIEAMFLRNQGPGRHVAALDAGAKTDHDGRFEIKPLVPGLFYSFEVLVDHADDASTKSEGYLYRGVWPLMAGTRLGRHPRQDPRALTSFSSERINRR